MIKFGGNIGSVKYGSTPISKIYFGSDLVYSGHKETIIDKIIARYYGIQLWIQQYPYLRQRIDEYPNLLFFLANRNDLYPTFTNNGDEYNYFVLDSSYNRKLTKIDGVMDYRNNLALQIYGSRLSYDVADTEIFANSSNYFFIRLGSAGTNLSLQRGIYNFEVTQDLTGTDNNFIGTLRLDKGETRQVTKPYVDYNWYPPVYGGMCHEAKPLGTNCGTGNRGLYLHALETDNHLLVPWKNSMIYDIKTDTVIPNYIGVNTSSFVVWNTGTKTIVDNPDISMLL
ncbi:MAG: hypothetical protein MJ245_02995 [Clostridia bacterium]|nr:hypothetical protein [Clostridia bacterium]